MRTYDPYMQREISMCYFHPYIQKFAPVFSYSNTEIDVIFECHKLWFLCRKPQKNYTHLYEWTTIPILINPFGIVGTKISFIISFIMFSIYMKTVFKVIRFYKLWNSILLFNNFEPEAGVLASKILKEFYLDKSELLYYFTRVITNIKYFHSKYKKL